MSSLLGMSSLKALHEGKRPCSNEYLLSSMMCESHGTHPMKLDGGSTRIEHEPSLLLARLPDHLAPHQSRMS